MHPAKIGIVEDEFIIAEDLKQIITSIGHEVDFVASTSAKAIEELKVTKPHLLLLDIVLKTGEDGIALADFVNKNYGIPFLFITANADQETVKKASNVFPEGYLMKPFTEADIFSSLSITLAKIDRAVSGFDNEKMKNLIFEDSVFIRDKNLMLKVKFDEILYLEADGNHAIVNTPSRKFILRKTLKEIEAELPSKKFLRIHKSYIVQLDSLTAIDVDYVYLGKVRLPIGRSYQGVFAHTSKFRW
jgi:DNA-binding LytR/AlgR family response regulator